jgi:transcription initiation factor IIE alpha subunit
MVKINQETYARLIKYLLSNDATVHDLHNETGLHKVTVSRLIRTFRKHKLVHICDWEADKRGRDQTMVIKWGQGKDKKRFSMTSTERQRLCRERKKEIAKHPITLLTPLEPHP